MSTFAGTIIAANTRENLLTVEVPNGVSGVMLGEPVSIHKAVALQCREVPVHEHRTFQVLTLINQERERQKKVEGWTPEHDDKHKNGELAYAASAYAGPVFHERPGQTLNLTIDPPIQWPWKDGYKPTPDDPIRQLVKAGALIVAEIERLQRLRDQKPA